MSTKSYRLLLTCALVLSIAFTGCKKKNFAPTTGKKSSMIKKTKAKQNIVAKEVSYKSGETTLKGYIAYDGNQKGKRPGVLIVHEWWGHNDYARRRARMLAKIGYVALALDMYGEGKNTAHPKDAGKFMMAIMKNIKEGENRFKAAQDVLQKHAMTDPKKLAAIGYCFGGAVVLHMARAGFPLAGVASFHGNPKALKKVKKGDIKAELLVMNGAADPFIKSEVIKAFKEEMSSVGAKYKFINYPGAKHAFTNPAATEKGKKFKIPLEYNKAADEKSWAEMKSFFARIFKS